MNVTLVEGQERTQGHDTSRNVAINILMVIGIWLFALQKKGGINRRLVGSINRSVQHTE